MWNFNYSAYDALVAPAIAKAQLWRLMVGIVLIIGVFMSVGSMVYTLIAQLLMAADGDPGFADVMGLLFAFSGLSLGVFGILYFIHDRLVTTLFGPRAQLLNHFITVCLAVSALTVVVAILPPWGFGDPLIPNRALGSWIAVLPIALLGIFVQISAEEILFRGYLQQNLAARFRSPLVWMLVPSILFGFAHYDPEYAGENAWILMIWAGLFGLAMADLTARAGNLGPAMAIHFVNNVSAILIVSMPGELDGAALYVLPFAMSDVELIRAWMPVDFALSFVMWLVARLVIRR